jgi:prepilin peptidase CpaA
MVTDRVGAHSAWEPLIYSLTGLLLLSTILTLAVGSDLRSHRIPNVLSACGLIAGLGLQGVTGGLHGLLSGLLGAAVGLAWVAPFYLRRGMGAGDLKLLAAAGAYLGPRGALYAAAATLLVGGLGAGGYVFWRATRASIGAVVHEGFASAGTAAFVAARLARHDRLPFAPPIALGGVAAYAYQFESTGLAALLSGVLR